MQKTHPDFTGASLPDPVRSAPVSTPRLSRRAVVGVRRVAGPSQTRSVTSPAPPIAPPPTGPSLSAVEIATLADQWVRDAGYQNLSPRTVEGRDLVRRQLVWWTTRNAYPRVGREQIKAFFQYLPTSHTEPGGRFGTICKNGQNTRPLNPRTIASYFRWQRGFWNWCVAEERLPLSPMQGLKPPVAPPAQVRPFNHEQIAALLRAAAASRYPRRDVALLLLMFDTGVRVSELTGMTVGSLEFGRMRSAHVLGKGRKLREIRFCPDTSRALQRYLSESFGDRPDQSAPLFLSERGPSAGQGLSRNGVQTLLRRLAKVAGLDRETLGANAVRVSPHTFRHSFAVTFLDNGGNAFSLRDMLGHTTLATTNRYVSYNAPALDEAHRKFSPVESLRKKK